MLLVEFRKADAYCNLRKQQARSFESEISGFELVRAY
jgi:hypothetical protein